MISLRQSMTKKKVDIVDTECTTCDKKTKNLELCKFNYCSITTVDTSSNVHNILS